MNASQEKVLQNAHQRVLTGLGLAQILQAQIAMAPRGARRTALEQHLRQNRVHADRVGERRREFGQGGNPLTAVVGTVESVVGQALALGKTPFDLLRGSGEGPRVARRPHTSTHVRPSFGWATHHRSSASSRSDT
jgi:hypothetical protein